VNKKKIIDVINNLKFFFRKLYFINIIFTSIIFFNGLILLILNQNNINIKIYILYIFIFCFLIYSILLRFVKLKSLSNLDTDLDKLFYKNITIYILNLFLFFSIIMFEITRKNNIDLNNNIIIEYLINTKIGNFSTFFWIIFLLLFFVFYLLKKSAKEKKQILEKDIFFLEKEKKIDEFVNNLLINNFIYKYLDKYFLIFEKKVFYNYANNF